MFRAVIIIISGILFGCGLKPSKAPTPRNVEVRFRLPEKEAPPVPPPALPGFFGLEATEDAVITDLNGILSEAVREQTRYADACDRYNAGEEIDEFKRGFDKALNQLSTRNDVVNSVAIGSALCILRYECDDYELDCDPVSYQDYKDGHLNEYQKLEDRTVLQIPRRGDGQLENITTRGLTIQALTNTLRPILHADDLMLAAYEGDQLTDFGGDTYYDIIEQQLRRIDFLADEGINIQNQFDDLDATMGGVNRSGVAFGSRLVIQLESVNGRARYTEDSSNVQAANINTDPFINEAAAALRDGDEVRVVRSNKIFPAIAREYIGDLPNGGHWYRIEDAIQDIAISVVPATVAISGRHGALGIDSQIRPSMCMFCHYKGIEDGISDWADNLRSHILANNFESDEKTIADNYMSGTRIRQYNNRVDSAYGRFLEQTGNNPRSRDATNTRLFNPFRDNVTVREAAGKFRLTPSQYLECLQGSIISPQFLGSHLTGGTVSLNDFAEAYPIVIEECNLNEDS